MALALAEYITAGLLVYGSFGLVFGVFFVAVGVGRVDAMARGTGPVFRLLILPGTAALWPLLLHRWIQVRRRQ